MLRSSGMLTPLWISKLLSLKLADRLRLIALSFSKAPNVWAARRSICASLLAQLGMTLRRGVQWGDGIVLRPDVNIRGEKKRGIRRCQRIARPPADQRCRGELTARRR